MLCSLVSLPGYMVSTRLNIHDCENLKSHRLLINSFGFSYPFARCSHTKTKKTAMLYWDVKLIWGSNDVKPETCVLSLRAFSLCCSHFGAQSIRETLCSLQFLKPQTVGRTPWTEDQPVARPLPTHRTARTE
jgi:hypothetical protein